MRCFRPSLALFALLLVAGCADQATPGPVDPSLAPSFDVTKPDLQHQIVDLFPGSTARGEASSRLAHVWAALQQGMATEAQNRAFPLASFALAEFYAGRLTDGRSTASQGRLLMFLQDLYSFVGLPALNLPPGALGPDGAVAVVTPTSPTTNVVTGTKFAGVQVPTGAVAQPTIVALGRIPDTFGPRQGPLFTPLDQYPLFYEYVASPAVPLLQDLTVGICDAETPAFVAPPGADLRIAHNVGSGIEILPLAAVPFTLDCALADVSLTLGASGTGFRSFALASWRGAGRLLQTAFLPQVLSAATLGTTGLGGTTRNFSPFGRVDLASGNGIRYLIGPADHTPGFESPSFVEGTGWQTGAFPFGSGSVPGSSCPLDGTVQTSWPAGTLEAPSDLLVRQTITLPAGFSDDLKFNVAIDNDVQVFVNGHEISDGLESHEGCATAGSFDFVARNNILQAGQNLVAIRARDRGVISYLNIDVVTIPAGQ